MAFKYVSQHDAVRILQYCSDLGVFICGGSMPRVAEAECATCHYIRPKTEMRQVRVRLRSTSSYRSSWGLTRSSRSRSVGTRDTYRHERVFVCQGCRAPRSDKGFGFFFTAAITLTILGGIGYSLVLGTKVAGVHALSRGAQDGGRANDTVLPTAEKPKDRVASEGMERSELPAIPMDESAGAHDIGEAASVDAGETRRPQFNFAIATVRDAEAQAVVSDAAVRWDANGRQGYSVASQMSVQANRDCRNVYSVLDGSEERSEISLWCKTERGDWLKV